MSSRQSAGVLAFRRSAGELQVLLVHPGGPFWKRKDAGAWSIPKGEFEAHEDALSAARREFQEELGSPLDGDFFALVPVRQRSGKTVHAFAIEADFDPSSLASNTVTLEWPAHSGKLSAFPEVDRAEWFTLEVARQKINAGQVPLLQQLSDRLRGC